MAAKQLTEQQINETVELLSKFRYANGQLDFSAAERASGISRSTLQSRTNKPEITKRLKLNEVIEDTIKPKEILTEKPRYIIKANSFPIKNEIRVIGIGDLHDGPTIPDKERFRWIARYVKETRPDRVVQIGDIASFDSCSTHESVGTIDYAQKPSFKQDMNSLEEALTIYYKELGEHSIPHDITLGNHEYRVYRWERANPAIEDGFYSQLLQLFARFGWKAHEYGDYLNVGGVRFTHVPHTQMGKPFGGKNSENQIMNEAVWSLVYGHTHKMVLKRAPKIGPLESIEILNLGSAMPNDYISKYANVSVTGWSYGIWMITIRNGHIVGHEFIPMTTLEERYRK